jgi:ribulose 1,5-bisphosphate carboxylase large subunit-like protein
MKWLRCASDDIKIFAIKDNLVNLSLIYNPTDEMVDFIKDDERFEVIKYPIFDRLPDEKLYCNFVFITNEDKLNEKETKKYFQSYQLYL